MDNDDNRPARALQEPPPEEEPAPTDEEIEASFQRFMRRPVIWDEATRRYVFKDKLH